MVALGFVNQMLEHLLEVLMLKITEVERSFRQFLCNCRFGDTTT